MKAYIIFGFGFGFMLGSFWSAIIAPAIADWLSNKSNNTKEK